MDRIGLVILAAALGATIALLALETWRNGRVRARRRAGFFDACARLFDSHRSAIAATGFPRLSGQYLGQTFHLQAAPDTLTFRKLPALWVLVTLPSPLPVRATLDVMIRPMGIEPFSNFRDLPAQIDTPPGFPEDCALRTDDPEALPDQDLLRQHLAIFDDKRVKELIVSPRGLRIVFLAEEAQRTRYLIYRDCEMGGEPLPPARVAACLDSLIALQQDILAADTAATKVRIA